MNRLSPLCQRLGVPGSVLWKWALIKGVHMPCGSDFISSTQVWGVPFSLKSSPPASPTVEVAAGCRADGPGEPRYTPNFLPLNWTPSFSENIRRTGSVYR